MRVFLVPGIADKEIGDPALDNLSRLNLVHCGACGSYRAFNFRYGRSNTEHVIWSKELEVKETSVRLAIEGDVIDFIGGEDIADVAVGIEHQADVM